jgi:hypothetical protein
MARLIGEFGVVAEGFECFGVGEFLGVFDQAIVNSFAVGAFANFSALGTGMLGTLSTLSDTSRGGVDADRLANALAHFVVEGLPRLRVHKQHDLQETLIYSLYP